LKEVGTKFIYVYSYINNFVCLQLLRQETLSFWHCRENEPLLLSVSGDSLSSHHQFIQEHSQERKPRIASPQAGHEGHTTCCSFKGLVREVGPDKVINNFWYYRFAGEKIYLFNYFVLFTSLSPDDRGW